jgi:hypothetical protein
MINEVTFQDILEFADENGCALRTRLAKEGLKTFDQFYTLRHKYCMVKFLEKYAGNKAPAMNVSASIVEFWKKCDAALQKEIAKTGVKFEKVAVQINSPYGQVTVDAIGSMNDHRRCIFKIAFSGSWRWRYAIEMVKQRDFLIASKFPDASDHELVAIVAGAEKDGDETISRFIKRYGELKKNGEWKEPTWDKLRSDFDTAVAGTQQFIENLGKEQVVDIPTNPIPGNCGTCQFHNVIINIGNKKIACSGFCQVILEN